MNHLKMMPDFLTDSQKLLIHEKSLNILEKVGVRAPFPPFLQLLKKHGAQVDEVSQTAKFPRRVIQEMLDQFPKQEETQQMKGLKGSISTEVFLVDYLTKTRRLGVLDDVKKGIALVEHLSEFPTSNAVVVPSDVPEQISDVESFYQLFSYSRKPGETYILSPFSAEYVIEMGKVIGRPISYGFQCLSPFQFTTVTLKLAMLFYEQGLKAACGPFAMSMVTSPVTPAGALLTQNAEQLACWFCNYCLGNRSFSYTSPVHPVDPATLLCSFGSPSLGLTSVAGASMAHFYGVPYGGNVGLTDSLEADFQAGFEKGFNMLLSAAAGGSSVGGQGIVGADQGISLEQLVIDNEWLRAYNHTVQGMEISEETLGEDLILEQGIGGNFLAEEHTVEHLQESYWSTKLFYRDSWDAWMREKKKTLLEKAADLVRDYTQDYKNKEPVISENHQHELFKILEHARRSAV